MASYTVDHSNIERQYTTPSLRQDTFSLFHTSATKLFLISSNAPYTPRSYLCLHFPLAVTYLSLPGYRGLRCFDFSLRYPRLDLPSHFELPLGLDQDRLVQLGRELRDRRLR